MRPTHFREYWEYTVEKVAVNAVMAGARPEYFPVILAHGRQRRQGARQHAPARWRRWPWSTGRSATRSSMNCGHRRAGPVQPRQRDDRPRLRPAVAEPARAARCPGSRYMGSQGNNYAYNSVTFAENEERSPWEPFHVQHGFKADRQHGQRVRRLRAHGVHARPARAHWREHVRNMLRGMDPARAADVCCWTRSPRGSSSTAAASTPRTKLIDWIYDNALHAGRRVLGLPARPELHLSARDVRRGAVRVHARRRRRTS